jgi:hypothetical protein
MRDWRQTGRERTRMAVRARDGFRCQGCRRKWKEGERHFDVHHLNGLCGKKSRGYDKLKDMASLTTLCHRCHYAHHAFSHRNEGGGARRFDRDTARRLVSEGKSYDRVGATLGVSSAAVYKALNYAA